MQDENFFFQFARLHLIIVIFTLSILKMYIKRRYILSLIMKFLLIACYAFQTRSKIRSQIIKQFRNVRENNSAEDKEIEIYYCHLTYRSQG